LTHPQNPKRQQLNDVSFPKVMSFWQINIDALKHHFVKSKGFFFIQNFTIAQDVYKNVSSMEDPRLTKNMCHKLDYYLNPNPIILVKATHGP
jgi:hypothetical protein